jgi:hypothetical protein
MQFPYPTLAAQPAGERPEGSWKWVQGETGQVSPCRRFCGAHKASEERQVRRPYASRN